MKSLKRLQRGQAAVEMAVTLIVLVPIIYYALFLADLLNYRLDQTEAINSTPWDYHMYDYNGVESPGKDKTPQQSSRNAGKQPGKSQTQTMDHFARLNLCDHYSWHQDFNNANECEDEHHRKSGGTDAEGANLAAHECWVSPGAHQVVCDIANDTYMATTGLLGQSRWNTNFNGGGLFSCSARLGVLNYFMPQKFMEWFSKQDVTAMKKNSGMTHADAADGSTTSANTVVFKEDTFSVLHDPWATNWPKKADGDSSGNRIPFGSVDTSAGADPFYERMKVHYDPAGLGYGGLAMSQVGWPLVRLKLLSPLALTDTMGDNPMSPVLAFDPAKQDRTTNGFRPSGWGDTRQQNSYSGRKNFYFGWDKAKW